MTCTKCGREGRHGFVMLSDGSYICAAGNACGRRSLQSLVASEVTLVHRWRVRGSGDEWAESGRTSIPVNATIEVETEILYPQSDSPWKQVMPDDAP